MNVNQALEHAASNVPNNITPEEVQQAAQYVFRAPTQDDMIRYMMGRGMAQTAPTEQAAMMAGMSAPAQQTPTPQEQAAVAAQAAPVASQAASTAAQVQNNATAAAGTQAAPQADYNQQLNDVIAQANRVGIGRPMSLGERGVLSQILGAKDMYNAAKDDAGRESAHALADAYRQAGAQYGLNDTTAALDATQLRALLQTDYDMGVNNAMQGKTSAEYFDDQYNALRKAGLTRNEATDEAARRAQRYQNERVRNLTNDLYTYGVDRDGSMNNNGAAILNLIYDEQPASAAMGMQNYATPIQNWKFNKNQEAANNAYQQKVDFGQKTFGWKKGLLDDQLAAQLTLAKLQDALQRYNIDKQSNDKRYVADKAAEARTAAASARSVGSAGGSGGSAGSSGGSGKGLTEGQKEVANYASNLLNDVKNGDASPQDLHDYLYSGDVEKKLDTGDLDSLRMLDYAGLFYWYKKNGIEGDPHGNSSDQQMAEVCRQIANNTSDGWKEQYVPGYNFDAWKD